MLQCATPESVIRLKNSGLRHDENHLTDCYFNLQRHDSLVEIPSMSSWRKIQNNNQMNCSFRATVIQMDQCDRGNQHSERITCARHNIENEYNQTTVSGQRRHVVFVIQLPRIAGGCFTGFQDPLPQRQPTDIATRKTLELSDTEAAGLEQKQPSRDVDGLVQQYIHAAGTILKDPEDMTDRKTEQVKLLLQLLKPRQSEDRTCVHYIGDPGDTKTVSCNRRNAGGSAIPSSTPRDETVRGLAPRPPVPHGTRPSSVPATLANSSYVFVRRDSHRPPLTPPYEGPYKVLTQGDKTFLLDYGNRQDSVSIDCLKPAFLYPVKPVEAAKRAPRGRPATNVDTKSGRLVKHPERYTPL
ncbi:hypothetical protein LSAT2_021643 [Lamellibrachia satsuma]|nr:hypothetical protein LSAT2_021643 [Lamellibrachia satsuma]